ncbi:heme exporter protein CcmB, partial [Pseudomonas aeruginosa]
MSNVFSLLLAREARLLFRRPAELANPLVFFAIVIALFPLAVGPESQLLQTLSPGLVWVAALLAVLLSLEGLFRSDFEDGSLEQWVLSPHPLALLVLAKVLAHWLFSGLALVLMSPLFALMLGLPARCIPVLLLSLLLGTPVLSLLGAVGAALTVGLKRGGLLLA